jgi:threonine/homoserine/homoserine lactone efflux protein
LTRFYLEQTFVSGVLLMALLLVLNVARIDIGYANSLMLAAAGALCILYVAVGSLRRWRKERSEKKAP